MDSLGHGIIGHVTQIRLLERWLEKPAHGYVFFGPSHLGKRTIAKRFIGRLLSAECRVPSAHPDLIVLEPEEGKTMISVEAVRDARARLSERPMVAPRMVMYVPNAERLNEAGMNALLKVLEEPPAGAVFVFVVEDLSKLPATVQSRLIKVPFHPVPQKEIADVLGSKAASAARGRPGLAKEPQGGAECRVPSAERFLHASSIGERLEIIDILVQECDAADDSSETWHEVLDGWAESFRVALPHQAETVLVASQGLLTAKRFVGGPLSPRLPLEAAAVRLAAKNPLKNIFPSPISPPYPRIFV